MEFFDEFCGWGPRAVIVRSESWLLCVRKKAKLSEAGRWRIYFVAAVWIWWVLGSNSPIEDGDRQCRTSGRGATPIATSNAAGGGGIEGWRAFDAFATAARDATDAIIVTDGTGAS